uniref:Uncharacterized protein n=1 Tax=Romanomermis culicivorax TaxID=13658 RepID=A0A915KEC4_ROMCU
MKNPSLTRKYQKMSMYFGCINITKVSLQSQKFSSRTKKLDLGNLKGDDFLELQDTYISTARRTIVYSTGRQLARTVLFQIADNHSTKDRETAMNNFPRLFTYMNVRRRMD